MKETDLEQIKRIHSEFYPDFPFPDFLKHFLCAFVVEQEDKIICAGGVRTICEAILITDKRRPVAIRREALLDMFSASMYVSSKNGYNALHAFVTEKGWKSHLSKVGFEPIEGEGLIVKF